MNKRGIKNKEALKRYKSENPWGMETTVDLKNCNPKTIRSYEKLEDFVIRLCDLIEMKRFGKPIIVNFGEDERVAGYSLTQLIETSLISGHFANKTNSAYLNIFSCKSYDPKKAIKFCKKYFEATECKANTNLRY
ncbi:hypothetical protein LDC_0043 [sediment metagenome]|uniref:S-adenosylmethionine decarboxylase n=1 Tax=sediment metagenome TaxID=749907 RepID=D9PEW5_9ZZZZ